MDDRWAHYDPSLSALLHPEQAHPYGLHSAGDGWSMEAVCAEFARLAYFRFEAGQRQDLVDALARARFGSPIPFISDGDDSAGGAWSGSRGAQAFGAISVDGALSIVSFRGTQPNSPPDLISDLLAWRVRWAGRGKVHKGFWRAYETLREPIDAWLRDYPPRRLVVTGHSLGAAMATLMAALYPEAELVTFGSPLVGNRDFAAAFPGRAVRYVDCSDVVTTVPYSLLGYVHVGEMRYIGGDGVVHAPPPPSEAIQRDRAEAKAEYRRRYLGPGNAPDRSFADHAPVNYVSAVAGKRRP